MFKRLLQSSLNPRFLLGIFVLCLTAGLVGAAVYFDWFSFRAPWSQDELETLRALSLSNLPPPPPDKSNLVADDPRAVALGHQLFFDKRFSADGKVSCASCHMPELNFQDARPRGRGLAETRRRTQSVVGSGYFAWFFWDGRKDSLWSQALAPLEHANEQGGDRTQYVRLIAENYRDEYEALFGALPDLENLPAHAGPAADAAARAAWDNMTAHDRQSISRVYANMGKALAAYQRKLLPGASRFDTYVDAVAANEFKRAGEIFSGDETAGLKLFIGKAGCVQCHNTPLLTDDEFHNTGVPQHVETEHDLGRAEGVVENFADEFKCWSEYSDDSQRDCPQLRYMRARAGSLVGAFKTPSLRKTQFVAPFMHNAAYTSLPEILDHYNRAPAAMVGASELKPLGLTARELEQLEAFLKTLTAPVNAPPDLMSPTLSASK